MPDVAPIDVEDQDDSILRRAARGNYAPISTEQAPPTRPTVPPIVTSPAEAPNDMRKPMSTVPQTPGMEGAPTGRHPGIPGYNDPDTGAYHPANPIAVSQLWNKAENIHNPVLRTLGKVGAGLARGIDSIASNAPFVSAIETSIPGTQGNDWLTKKRAQAADAAQAKTDLEKAQTKNQESEAESRANKEEKPIEAAKTVDTDKGIFQWNPESQRYDIPVGEKAPKPLTRAEQPITTTEAQQINAEREQTWQVMHPKAPLPDSYKSKVGDTRDDVKDQDERFSRLGGAEGTAATREATAAQREQNNQFRQDELNQKAAGKYYAVDGKIVSGDRITDEQKGRAFPVKDPEKAMQSISATNATLGAFGRYKSTVDKANLSQDDIRALQILTQPAAVAHGFAEKETAGLLDSLFGEPLTGYSTKAMQGIMTKDQYDKLSPDGQRALVNYYNAIIANFADMKQRLGGIGRNESMIQAEIHTIPLPYISKQAADEAFETKMQDVASRNIYMQGQHPTEPPRPANVPAGFIYQENGPKGKGWYRPNAQ